MQMSNKYFGVTLSMTQRLNYESSNSNEHEKARWNLKAFGFFDYISIELIEDINDFSHQKMEDDLLNNSSNKRNNWQPDIQKIFLYGDVDWGKKYKSPNADTRRELLELYAHKDDTCKPFFAFFAVKFRQCFIEVGARHKCQLYAHIEKHLTTAAKADIDVCAMRSLSVDDVYIFVAADSPAIILDCLSSLSNFHCNAGNKCNGSEMCTHIFPSDVADESYTRLIKNVMKDKVEYCSCEKCSSAIAPTDWCADRKRFELVSDWIITTAKSIMFNNNSVSMSFEKLKQQEYEYGKILGIECFSDFPFEYQYLLLRLWNAIFPLLPSFPIASTHSIFGCIPKKTTNHAEPLNEIKISLKIRLRPGRFPAKFLEVFQQEIKAYDELAPFYDKCTLLFMIGRYDCIWQLDVTPSQLIALHKFSQDMCSGNWIEHSSIEFLRVMDDEGFYERALPAKGNTPAIEQRQILIEIHDKETIMANSWVKTQQQKANNFFQVVGSKYKKSFPWLHEELAQYSLLHAQAMNKFYMALVWKEFNTARSFWEKFFKKIEREFDYFNSHECKMKDRADYALMIYASMRNFRETMSGILNYRITLDMSMRTNTTGSVYATGAYEDLLKGYRIWIRRIISVLCEIANLNEMDKSEYSFGLRPTSSTDDSNMIYSDHLFPLSETNGLLVIFGQPFDRMLDIQRSLMLWGHEVSHHIGLIDPENRTKAFFHMVTRGFARYLADNLASRTYAKIPTIALETQIINIADSMYKFLDDKCRTSGTDIKNINNLVANILDWTKAIFSELGSNTIVENEPDNPFIKSIIELYDVLDDLAQLTDDGPLSTPFLEEILNAHVLVRCEEIVSELSADMAMIHLFTASEEEYFDVLLDSLVLRDSQTRTTPDVGHGLDAIRAFSAIMLVVARENPNLSYIEISPFVDQRIEERIAILLNTTGPSQKLAEVMQKEIDDSSRLSLTLCDIYCSKYLFDAGREFHQRLSSVNPTELKKLQEVYQHVKDNKGDTLSQLVLLLRLSE